MSLVNSYHKSGWLSAR